MADKKDKDSKSNDIGAYQAAISLMVYEGNLVWTRFGVLFAISSAVVGAISFFSKNNNSFSFGSIYILILSLFGFIVSYFWLVMTTRGFTTLKMWTVSARKIEESLDHSIDTLQRGNEFRLRGILIFKFKKGEEKVVKIENPWYSRSVRTEDAARGLIYIFLFGFLLLFLLSIYFLGVKNNKQSVRQKQFHHQFTIQRSY